MFKKIDEIADKNLPTVRDYDNFIYLRKFKDSFLCGMFEPNARSWNLNTKTSTGHQPGIANSLVEMSADQWDHMSPFIHNATNRLNLLKAAKYDMLINTPDAFTPDGRWIIGESPEVSKYFVCVGMNGNSLQVAMFFYWRMVTYFLKRSNSKITERPTLKILIIVYKRLLIFGILPPYTTFLRKTLHDYQFSKFL